MAQPAVVNIISYFYPIGNTPAVSLTQDVPHGVDANILLLGCGDVRNILFTASADVDSVSRMLNITCCDLEKSIIARNILLFTLLLDDAGGANSESIWDIYYHFYLDDACLDILVAHTRKLMDLAASLESWVSTTYGKVIRFCDEETLRLVKLVWASFLPDSDCEEYREEYDNKFRTYIQRSLDKKDPGLVTTALRSAFPVIGMSTEHLPALYDQFWSMGSIGKTTAVKNANPMFASAMPDTFTLHYGTDPLLGFHLAAAYAPLATNTSFKSAATMIEGQQPVRTAQSQFKIWSAAFRKYADSKLTMRFFAGDALVLCHALHSIAQGQAGHEVHYYRAQYNSCPLILHHDYQHSVAAPLKFDVIDTSNLADHIGALNLLSAAALLLARQPWSTLYTEVLVKKFDKDRDFMDQLLCGPCPTVATLLGLIPSDYWQNATCISAHESLLDVAHAATAAEAGSLRGGNGQYRARLTWKNAIPVSNADSVAPRVVLGHEDLARIVHRIYRNMFEHENVQALFSGQLIAIQRKARHQMYHRGSLAWLLKSISETIDTNWDSFMESLLNVIEEDTQISMTKNYIQEFYVQLHLLGLYSVPALRTSRIVAIDAVDGCELLRGWQVVPPVVCVTIEIPREHLKALTEVSRDKVGTPVMHCIIQSNGSSGTRPWQNIFNQIHLIFGHATTTGAKDSETLQINLTEDHSGWSGLSSLFASFHVPSWILLLEPETTFVAFGLHSDPHSASVYSQRLGLEMNIFRTSLTDRSHVSITNAMPNLTSGPSQPHHGRETISPGDQCTTKTLAALSSHDGSLDSFTTRIESFPPKVKSSLQAGAKVGVIQDNPFSLIVTIGASKDTCIANFPAPVMVSQAKIRISRKSAWIELTAPIADHIKAEGNKDFVFIAFVDEGVPRLWNMPYLASDQLPVLDITRKSHMEWLNTTMSLQLSSRERALRDKNLYSASPGPSDLRIEFKDSLFSIFMHFTGLQGGKASIFGINNPTGGGVHIIIIPCYLRLDASRATVVLDCAILPLSTDIMSSIHNFLGLLTQAGMCSINVDAAEMTLWKQLLPQFVERCRTWEHGRDCEYRKTKKVPLSTAEGEKTLCSCGRGQFPPSFNASVPKLGDWKKYSKYFTRAAISPIFSVPYVEKQYQPEMPSRQQMDVHNTDRCWRCARKENVNGGKLLACARCHAVKYCSKECQKTDWKTHKGSCRAP